MRAGRAGTGGTLGPTATPPQTERGQRNEDGLGPFHEKISKASAMLRSGGDYNYNLSLAIFFITPLILLLISL